VNELALFAGAGGGLLASQLLGWRTVCAVELDWYCRCVLVARQNDRTLGHSFPIWDDVCTFDGRPWKGRVDVISGGFPCQDISAAGKGAGITGDRSGMWFHMARIVGEVRPRFVFVENSPMLCSRGLGTVLGDLAALGYDAKWGVLGAVDVGAPHQRDRIWIVADANNARQRANKGRGGGGISRKERHYACGLGDDVANKESRRLQRTKWWKAEPDVGRVAHGVAARVDRLKAIGNGQVPAVAATAWRMLTDAN
jgi:DNA (cytosine-5)-methyltransferase 1